MRLAYQDKHIIEHQGIKIGFSLGYDYCAEHEWGINGLKRLFGIPKCSKENMGINGRKITQYFKKSPFDFEYQKLNFQSSDSKAILYVGNPDHIPLEMKGYENLKEDLMCAWCDNSFGIAVKGKENVKFLSEIYQEFLNLNIIFASISGSSIFSNSPLAIMIADRVPEEFSQAMYLVDKVYFDLIDYEKEIGMTEIKEKYGNKNGYKGAKYFMACSPKWIDYNNKENLEIQKKKLKTQYNIHYWINYSDADDHYGWHSVEQIKEWLTTPGLTLKQIYNRK